MAERSKAPYIYIYFANITIFTFEIIYFAGLTELVVLEINQFFQFWHFNRKILKPVRTGLLVGSYNI